MNKILTILLLGTVAVIVMAPGLVLAQTGPQECCRLNQEIRLGPSETYPGGACVGEPGATSATCACAPLTNPTTKWGLICTLNIAYTVINWFFLILIIVVIGLTFAGAWDIMMTGDPGKTLVGRNKILAAAIGLLIALGAKAVPSIVRYFLGAA